MSGANTGKKEHKAPAVNRFRGTIGSPGVKVDRRGSLKALDERFAYAERLAQRTGDRSFSPGGRSHKAKEAEKKSKAA